MNKTKIVLALILVLVLHTGCSTIDKRPPRDVPEDIKRIFIGTWEGEHVNSEGRTERTWIQKRSADGTYRIAFVHYTAKGVRKTKRQGKWWLEGDRFHEISPDVMKKPDVYEFEILSEDEIRFKSVVKDYEFSDKRVETSREPAFI
jgi:hypothetical protein